MTTAIRSTVQEFLSPHPPKNTPFSQSRIRQKILSRQLDGRDPLPTIKDVSSDEDRKTPTEESPKEEDLDAEDSSSTTLPPDSPSSLRSRTDGQGSTTLPNPESITAETIDKHMYTAADPPLDMFVRTSGVQRLSDFMLWQCHQNTQIFFIDCLWPDFDLYYFLRVLLEWQWRLKQRERDEAPNRGNRRRQRVE
jgi:ditrans,polycis-polyprenyl diphosphate synthase